MQETLQQIEAEFLAPARLKAEIDAVASLAGGLAHDLNNHLTGILGCAEVLVEYPEGPDGPRLAHEIWTAAKAVARLAAEMSNAGRMRAHKEVEGSFEAVGVMQGVLLAARRLVPPKIELKSEFADEVLRVDCGPGRLARVLMAVVLKSARVSTPPDALRLVVEPRVGPEGQPWVYLGVQGAACHAGLVSEDDPDVLALNELGAVWQTAPHALGLCLRRIRTAQDEPSAGEMRHTTRVLVVDDEPGVQHLLATVLRRRGCEVFVVGDVDSAVELTTSSEVPFDVVIADLSLPWGAGFARWHQLRQQISFCIIMTGRGPEPALEREVAAMQASLLYKPFTPHDVTAVLERRTQG